MKGPRILVATRHGKAAAMQRPFGLLLGATLWSPPELDTDRFGTFSGEIERPGIPEAMLAAKIDLARQQYPARQALASEGSYGPHPYYPGVAIGQEWLLWDDLDSGLQLLEKRSFLTRYYAAYRIETVAHLDSYLERCGWPALHVTLHNPACNLPAAKGLKLRSEIASLLHEMEQTAPGQTTLATDMRAHLHPPRQRTLRRLAARLAHRLRQRCPQCGLTGFGIHSTEHGLPCADCRYPTGLTWRYFRSCPHCQHRTMIAEVQRPADPAHCPYCNP